LDFGVRTKLTEHVKRIFENSIYIADSADFRKVGALFLKATKKRMPYPNFKGT